MSENLQPRSSNFALELSRMRPALMGVAILWVIFFHSQMRFGPGPPGAVLTFVKQIGYFGVDVFFLLSGMGLAVGWLSRPPGLGGFFGRRLSRILPSYWALLLIGYLTLFFFGRATPLTTVLSEAMGVHFLVGGRYHLWFIDCILACYLAFPLLITLQVRLRNRGLFLGLITLVALALALGLSAAGQGTHLVIFVLRWPTFALGMVLGQTLVEREGHGAPASWPWWVQALLLGLGTGLLLAVIQLVGRKLLWRWGLWWYPTLLMAFPFAALGARLLDRLSRSKVTRWIVAVLGWLGERSLEIYVTQVLLFDLIRLLRRGPLRHVFPFDLARSNWGQLLYLVGAILIAAAVQLAVNLVRTGLKRLLAARPASAPGPGAAA